MATDVPPCPAAGTGAPLRSLLLRNRPPYAAATTVAGKWRREWQGAIPRLPACLTGPADRASRPAGPWGLVGPRGGSPWGEAGGKSWGDWLQKGVGEDGFGGTASGERGPEATLSSFSWESGRQPPPHPRPQPGSKPSGRLRVRVRGSSRPIWYLFREGNADNLCLERLNPRLCGQRAQQKVRVYEGGVMEWICSSPSRSPSPHLSSLFYSFESLL